MAEQNKERERYSAIEEGREFVQRGHDGVDYTKKSKFKIECDTGGSDTNSRQTSQCTISMNKKWKWIILYAGVLVTISLLGVTLQSSKKGEEEGGKIERTMDVMSSAVVKAGNMFNTSSLLPTLVQIVQDSQRLYQRRKERENNRRQKKENREEEQQSVGALKEGQAEVHENYREEEEEGGGKWPSQRGRSNQTAV